MNKNYNEQYEQDIQEILNQFKGYGYNYDYLLEIILNKYEETNYPGYLYILGLLYERKILKSKDSNIHLSYYKSAANMNYLPALIALNQICLEDIRSKIDHHTLVWNNKINYHILKDDKEGKYQLAKLKMISQILNDELDEYFLGALTMMESSAKEGCEEAIIFMKIVN